MLLANWVLAARPATLWASVAPVLVGTAISLDDGAFRIDVFVTALIAATAIQIGVNFANDLADAARGVDNTERIGPPRAVSSGLIASRQMQMGVGAAFGVAAVMGSYLATVAGPIVLAIGVASFIAALGYTNGPYPYGYKGLGELFVFIFFGLVATAGMRFVYDGQITARAWFAGVVMGFLATAILIANNVRDAETDKASNKRTLAVILGDRWARILYVAVLSAAYATVLFAVTVDAFEPLTLLTLAAMPLAVTPVRIVLVCSDGPQLITALKETARLQIVTAMLLAVGLLA